MIKQSQLRYYPLELLDLIVYYEKEYVLENLSKSENCQNDINYFRQIIENQSNIRKIRTLVYCEYEIVQQYFPKLLPKFVTCNDEMFLIRIYQIENIDLEVGNIIEMEFFLSDIFLGDIGNIPIGYQIMELKVFCHHTFNFIYVLVHDQSKIEYITKSKYIIDIENQIINNILLDTKKYNFILPQSDSEFSALLNLIINSHYTIQERLCKRSNLIKEQLTFLFNQVNELSALESFSSVFESKDEKEKSEHDENRKKIN